MDLFCCKPVGILSGSWTAQKCMLPVGTWIIDDVGIPRGCRRPRVQKHARNDASVVHTNLYDDSRSLLMRTGLQQKKPRNLYGFIPSKKSKSIWGRHAINPKIFQVRAIFVCTTCSAMNGAVLSGFLTTTCNFWIVDENPKCFDEFIEEKSCQTSKDFQIWKDILELGNLLYDIL